MTSIVCIKAGDKYGAEYVNRLASMARRHTERMVPFICLTDDPKGIRDDVAILPLQQTNLRGWWHKLTLFMPPRGLEDRRLIFLDLDTVITGPIDFLFDFDGPFCILADFYQPEKFNSSVMSIAPGFGRHIWERFVVMGPEKVMGSYYGDQEWITDQLQWAHLWQVQAPGKIASYKANELRDGPKDASIVCFHGEPKPHEFDRGWVRDAWI